MSLTSKSEFGLTTERNEGETERKAGQERLLTITLRIETTIVGRNLEFIAQYPPTPDGQIIRGTRRHFSVAGALPVSAD